MKKIIELAEKVVEVHRQPESDKAVNQLAFAIIERRELEQTPITEDWLKAHGWHISDIGSLRYARLIISTDMLEYKLDRHELTVFRDYEPESGVYTDAPIDDADRHEFTVFDYEPERYIYADVLIDDVDNIAKLYDACDLCGIKID